jgi:hypothetical protein
MHLKKRGAKEELSKKRRGEKESGQKDQKGMHLQEIKPEAGVYHGQIWSIYSEMRSIYGQQKTHTVIRIQLRSGLAKYSTVYTA